MDMARRNVVAGIAIALFGIVYAVLIQGLPERTFMPNTPGPAFFPTVIATALLALSVLLVASGFKELRKPYGRSESSLPSLRDWPPMIVVGAFFVYLAALPTAGFVLSSVVFFAILMWLFGCRSKILIAGASIAIPVILFVLFRYGFQIILPRGQIAF